MISRLPQDIINTDAEAVSDFYSNGLAQDFHLLPGFLHLLKFLLYQIIKYLLFCVNEGAFIC